MARSTDTGHDINVANFEKMIGILRGFGNQYAPAQTRLTLTELEKALAEAKIALKAAEDAKIAYKSSNAARSDAFKPINKLITRLLAALMTTDALDGVKESGKVIADRIRGQNTKSNDTPAAPETPNGSEDERSHSTSQQSYDKKASNLRQFLQIIETEKAFRTAPDVLTKAFWTEKQASLAAAN